MCNCGGGGAKTTTSLQQWQAQYPDGSLSQPTTQTAANSLASKVSGATVVRAGQATVSGPVTVS
jgi:hypothetical protein